MTENELKSIITSIGNSVNVEKKPTLRGAVESYMVKKYGKPAQPTHINSDLAQKVKDFYDRKEEEKQND